MLIGAPPVDRRDTVFFKSKMFLQNKFDIRKRLGIAPKPKLEKKKTTIFQKQSTRWRQMEKNSESMKSSSKWESESEFSMAS
mmetsp:Transcript_22329/g.34574  ORF Transcript_22329/g.34574 Transcript_22329/m.34574 type:complete len:82 (-) Transcript_22329:2334-2579(-)